MRTTQEKRLESKTLSARSHVDSGRLTIGPSFCQVDTSFLKCFCDANVSTTSGIRNPFPSSIIVFNAFFLSDFHDLFDSTSRPDDPASSMREDLSLAGRYYAVVRRSHISPMYHQREHLAEISVYLTAFLNQVYSTTKQDSSNSNSYPPPSSQTIPLLVSLVCSFQTTSA